VSLMEPPRLSAPASAASSSSRSRAASVDSLPGVHERLARPETREEYFFGELRLKVPASPPHARQHLQLAYVLKAHVAEGYLAAVEMLTRTSRDTDFAPDASVYPAAPDPQTGERRLEELAFEVCSEQSLEMPKVKARELVGRGVRRVFCIVVGGLGQKRRKTLEESYVLEWSQATGTWSPIAKESRIEDRCLSPPLPVSALIDATASDDAVVRALRARDHRIFAEERAAGFAEGKAQGHAEGKAQGHAEALVSVIEARGLALSPDERSRILDCRDPRLLERWTRRALTVGTASELWPE